MRFLLFFRAEPERKLMNYPGDWQDGRCKAGYLQPLTQRQRRRSEYLSDSIVLAELNHDNLNDGNHKNYANKQTVFADQRKRVFVMEQGAAVEFVPELEHDKRRKEDRQRLDVLSNHF